VPGSWAAAEGGAPVSEGDEHSHEPLEEPDEGGREWPVKGPATPQQAIVAIGFVFFLGVLIGVLLCKTF
jgi:hypothetical protein